MGSFYVYIMTNKRNTVLYTGITNNLIERMWEHRESTADRFGESDLAGSL
ncbi:MAG: GIY-YIG nuclease family protein [bacterium]